MRFIERWARALRLCVAAFLFCRLDKRRTQKLLGVLNYMKLEAMVEAGSMQQVACKQQKASNRLQVLCNHSTKKNKNLQRFAK